MEQEKNKRIKGKKRSALETVRVKPSAHACQPAATFPQGEPRNPGQKHGSTWPWLVGTRLICLRKSEKVLKIDGQQMIKTEGADMKKYGEIKKDK